MKRILGLFIFNLFFTLSAYPQEVGDSVSNSSGPTKLRLFWKNVGFGKELFGKDNVGAIFRQAPVRSINGKIGAVTLNKTDVGLSNVNNTADINKPISALTQAALDAKEPLITPGGPAQYFTGLKTWANLDKAAIGLSNVVNLDQSNAANLLSGTIASGRYGPLSLPLSAIAQGGATSGQVISWNGTNWAAATMSGGGGGSGEANTASNVGVGGIGLFKQKTSLNLEFRNINSSGKLTVTLDAANNEVDLDIVDANLSIAGTQLTGTIPAARFGSLSVPPSAISQGGASTNQVLQWNGSAWTGAGLGTAAFLNVASSGNAATGEVVKGNDTRLTDSRTPTTHVHAAGDITTGTFSSALFGNGTIATTKLAQTGATTGQAILWDGTAWNPGTVSAGSGGEANTASNVNTGGIGVFNGKVGVDLQFKGVAAASTKVSVSNNTTTKTVDVDVVDSNLSIAGSQLTGTIPAARFGATTIPISAFNVTGTASSSTYLRGDGTWTALSGTGEVNTGSNVNTAGVGVYNGKVGADLQFKGVAAGSSKLTVTNNTTNKTVDIDVADANLSIAGSQLTGTIPAARMPAYSGDVVTTVGTVVNTIGTNAVTNAKAAQMAANTIKGNNTGATANQADLTVSQVKTMLSLNNVDNTSDASKPVSTATQTALNAKENSITAGTTAQYWRGDKAWTTLDKSAVGLGNVPNVDATNATNLTSGSIPAARYGATTVPLSALNATGTASSTTYLRGDNTWSTLPGAGWDIVSYTVSNLRAATATAAYVFITDSGKQGIFAYDSSDTSTADNTGTVIVTANGRRYKRVINDKSLNVGWFAVTGDGTTNDNAGVLAAFNLADGTNYTNIFVPAGNFKINVDAITVASGVSVIGANGAKFSAATTPTSQANLLTTTGSNVTIDNIEFVATTFYVRGFKATGGTNIRFLNCKANTAALVELISCTASEIRGCYAKTTQNFGLIATQSSAWSCVRLQYSNYINISDGYIDGYGHSIQFDGGDPNNYLGATNVPVPITVARGGKNVVISNIRALNGVGGGIWGNMYDAVLIQHCQVENFQDVGIDFEGCTNSKASFCTIKNCVYGSMGLFYWNGQIEFDNITSIVTSSTYHHLIMADIQTSVDVGSQYLKFTNCTFQAEGHISQIGDVAQIFGSFKYIYVQGCNFKNTYWNVTTPGHYKEITRSKFDFTLAANGAAISVAGFSKVNGVEGRAVIADNEIYFRNGTAGTNIGLQTFAGETGGVNYLYIERNKVIGATVDLNTKFTISSATYIPFVYVNKNIFAEIGRAHV